METSAYHPFRSSQAQDEYLTHYDERAKGWPVKSETRLVSTSFGQTFVRISGPRDSSPLVLLPGSVLNSLMWIPNVRDLSREYCTYAVDNIYDCGRSIYTRAFKTPDDFTQWMDELFTVLELGDQINLLGLSYGSWLINKYALRFPHRLNKIVMLAHPAIVSVNIKFVFYIISSLVSPRYFEKFIYWLLEYAAQKDEASKRFMQDTFKDMQLTAKCFVPKATVIPTVVKDSELTGLQIPTLFLMGGNEKTFPYQKALQRINKIAPHLKTEIIPNAGHGLSFVQADLVNKRVLEFLK
jgi:pimeloyl-ACP methyl ester carboxylesterase